MSDAEKNGKTSFKGLAAAGVLKKADKFRARPQDLKVEPGFNLRVEGPELDAHVDAICNSIMLGYTVPPMEVRLGDDGSMLIVDGHCRHRAYLKAISLGAEIEFVDVLPFFGNDVARVAKMIVSSQGRPLTPLETALGYARFINFGWESQKIAENVGKTKVHVDQLLILANANNDVHQLVASGKVSAYTAIDVVREHGERAGEYLQRQIDGLGEGKKKVTTGTIKGKSLPKKVVASVLASFDAFRIDSDTASEIESYRNLTPEKLAGKKISIDASTLLGLVNAKEAIEAARSKVKAKDEQGGGNEQ